MAKFGAFSSDGYEYIITDYQTPRPLMNYVWNARLLSGINHFGGGAGSYGGKAASYIDPQGRGRAVLIRDGNRYFYIRDERTGQVWNPGWYPVKNSLDFYRCTHGLGYTVVEGEKDGVRAVLTGFAALEEPAEIWRVRLENRGEPRTVKIYSFAEFSLEGYPAYSEYDSYVHAEYDSDRHLVYAANRAQERPYEWFDGFMAASARPSGFETSRRSFFGAYGDVTAPEAVMTGRCSGRLAACERMAGVLEHTFYLDQGESAAFDVVIGAADSRDRAAAAAEILLAPGRAAAELEEWKRRKRRLGEKLKIQTPSQQLNHLVNVWLKQQVQLCAEAGRATGKGFRDQLQDAWAIAAFRPELAREKILETLGNVYQDGRCVRGWMPLDPHIYSDGPVWVGPVLNGYLKETADASILDEEVGYLDGGSDTVWDHILTVTRYSSGDLGGHGLVLAHDGDWNDSLNGIGVGGRGESVWTSIALYQALLHVAEIAELVKQDQAVGAEMRRRAERIRRAVNEAGWDGEWFLAAYRDDGAPVGSHTETEGKIYLNSQTWAVLTGIAGDERRRKCLDAVDRYLDSPYGPLTLYPSYSAYEPKIGRLTGFVPGIWENGSPYCHGGSFKVVADCAAGRGDEAWSSLQKIMPDSTQNPSEHSGCEPYAFTNMYLGPDNPRAGETSFAWVTGTAGWVFRAVTQYMLGFFPGYHTIRISPCLPSEWTEAELVRRFRGDVYRLHIRNPDGLSGGDKRVSVDGREIDGDCFEIFGDGREHEIEVLILQTEKNKN